MISPSHAKSSPDAVALSKETGMRDRVVRAGESEKALKVGEGAFDSFDL